MVEMTKMNGQCLCGAVKFTANNADLNMGACHCDMCRKTCSSPFFAVECENSVEFNSEENIARYDSSEWGQRGFCKQCGSVLFYFLKPKSAYMISAGLFENQKDFVFGHQIFIDEKPSYYCFSNETVNMTGEEVFAEVTKND